MGIEDDIKRIVSGSPVSVENRLNIKSEQDLKFVPMTKKNMCYICGCVLFDEEGRVLLIQEAKKSCRGLWYLPAGRLEHGETIIAGALREAKEESGLECNLTALLSVEINSPSWMRFIFTGKITGGKLKTTEDQDSESLQAKFFSKKDIEMSPGSLRCADMLKLIDAGRKYWATDPSDRGPDIIPTVFPHHHVIHRVVIVDRSSSEGVMHVLASLAEDSHIPSALVSQSKQASIAVSVYAIIQDVFSTNSSAASIRMCGILGVEHRGTGAQEDGICITSLVSLDISNEVSPPTIKSSKYQWCPVQDLDVQKILNNGTKGKLIPLL